MTLFTKLYDFYFPAQIKYSAKSFILMAIFFSLSSTISAQKITGIEQTRTAQTIGTIIEIHKAEHSSNSHWDYTPAKNLNAEINALGFTLVGLILESVISSSSAFIYRGLTPARRMSKNESYTVISYGGRTFIVDYALDGTAYKVGDKLIVKYNPYDSTNVVPVLERPCFEQGELADTTEGILNSVGEGFCHITYKVYNPSDSMDIKIVEKGRYLSKGMHDSLFIKKNCTYKIIYNRQSEKMEILFNSVVDSTHLDRNKHLYRALTRITNGNSIDAIRDLNEYIRLDSLDPQNYYYYYHLAKAKEEIREYKDAAEYFTKYIEAKPKDIRGYVRRAKMYIMLDELEAAQKDVTQLFNLGNESGEAYYLQGMIYASKDEYQKAIDSYTNAINYSNGINLEVYYYSRAEARKKLYGYKNKECKEDYKSATEEAIKYDNSNLDIFEERLERDKHKVYVTLTSDNTLSFNNSAYQSNMQAELIVPYTLDNTVHATFDKTISLNNSKQATTFSLGLLSVEVGGIKSIYGRIEMAVPLNNGSGPPIIFRSVLGYNIKFKKSDVLILRPEMGFTYFNRLIDFGTISFNGGTQININDKNFIYKKNPSTNTDNIAVSFRENVLSLSPSIGLWLWPYSSKFVMRVGLGYNFVLCQNYSIYFKSTKGHLREDLGNLNLQFSNTNGSSSNFFSYNGLFINVGVGVRF